MALVRYPLWHTISQFLDADGLAARESRSTTTRLEEVTAGEMAVACPLEYVVWSCSRPLCGLCNVELQVLRFSVLAVCHLSFVMLE
ncbi:uncharacterized protein SPSK_05747 [Sporothrix schenckii 1099-18]|uniref:Uncharacterized protein n=1 Tax=Sporothrix schenckii 1099-18 TaxID=1397361 RepID=A0A0F2LTU2_SPOSC|nr:uncharacterized protein SPSK_05747 [Sporothrix schenckii 1099-18]KJR80274.1 hypothetical protein SPSK_05747 [Sporothrix schenckii 1099-18]